MLKAAQKEDQIDKVINQLMDSGRGVFDLGKGIKLYITLQNTSKKWLMDTYLYDENKPTCYSVKGMARLRDLATRGQLSDGVLKIEKNDKQAFALFFVDDLATGFSSTIGFWVETIKALVNKDGFTSTISTNWKNDDPRIWV